MNYLINQNKKQTTFTGLADTNRYRQTAYNIELARFNGRLRRKSVWYNTDFNTLIFTTASRTED